MWGLLTNQEGCPVAIEVLTALRAPRIRKLHRQGVLQLSLFDEDSLAEIQDPDHPDRRLVVCRNWQVAEERRRKREELLEATKIMLSRIKERVSRGRLKDEQKIALAVGKVINKFKVEKHFEFWIGPGYFEFAIREDTLAQEAALDGIYVVETTADPQRMSSQGVVEGYKSLPIYHRLADRVRAHAFLCMLAYYVIWHMERALTPLKEQQPDTYQSFQHVLYRLEGLQLNTVQVEGVTFDVVTEPDPQQQLFLDHLGVKSLLPKPRALQKH